MSIGAMQSCVQLKDIVIRHDVRGERTVRLGIFFSESREYAKGFSTSGGSQADIENGFPNAKVYDVYLKIEKPIRILQSEILSETEVREIEQQIENGEYDGISDELGQHIVFDSSQIKSSDPVTYDDNGNIIPLSERFNSENDDIRWSAEDENEDEWYDEGYERVEGLR